MNLQRVGDGGLLKNDKWVNIYAFVRVTVSGKIPCYCVFDDVCYDTTYNQSCEGANIFRANDWGEVYELITQFAARYTP